MPVDEFASHSSVALFVRRSSRTREQRDSIFDTTICARTVEHAPTIVGIAQHAARHQSRPRDGPLAVVAAHCERPAGAPTGI